MKTRLGRVPAPPVALPDINREAQAIADWLKEREGPQRRPEQTARVLALAAEHTGVSLPMLDVVMSQRQATKDITVWTATASGNIRKHESIVTQRFIQPSDELINVVQRNMLQRTKDAKNAKRRERAKLGLAKQGRAERAKQRREKAAQRPDFKTLASPAPNSV